MSFRYDARPDEAAFRDKLYQPSLINVPAEAPIGTYLRRKVPVLNQGQEGACTLRGRTCSSWLFRRSTTSTSTSSSQAGGLRSSNPRGRR